jgi:hypothetical protein
MNFGPVDYDSLTPPPSYCCSECGQHGVKLWREYQTFADHINLTCGPCTVKDQDKEGHFRDDGKFFCKGSLDPDRPSDAVGWRVPAIPTVEGDTYWGYTSVPTPGVLWWYRLPLDPEVAWTIEGCSNCGRPLTEEMHAVKGTCRQCISDPDWLERLGLR